MNYSSDPLGSARDRLADRLARFNDVLADLAGQVRTAIGRAVRDAAVEVIHDAVVAMFGGRDGPEAQSNGYDPEWNDGYGGYGDRMERDEFGEYEPPDPEAEPASAEHVWRPAIAIGLQIAAWFLRNPQDRTSLAAVVTSGIIVLIAGFVGGSLAAAVAAGSTVLGLLALVEHLPDGVASVRRWLPNL